MSSRRAPSAAMIELAARLYIDAEMRSFRLALMKASEHLGQPFQAPADYLAIELAAINYQRLFNASAWDSIVRHKRMVALEAMSLLEDFQPRLIGELISGAVHAQTPIRLLVFCEANEWVLMALQDAAIPIKTFESERRLKAGGVMVTSGFKFFAGDDEIRVEVLPELSLRQRPLDPVSGQAQAWMKHKALVALLDKDRALLNDS